LARPGRGNMSRSYTHCFECNKRMRKFSEDADGDRVFYFCRSCGRRWTYMPLRNAASEDWPKDVYDKAVAGGVMTRKGELLV